MSAPPDIAAWSAFPSQFDSKVRRDQRPCNLPKRVAQILPSRECLRPRCTSRAQEHKILVHPAHTIMRQYAPWDSRRDDMVSPRQQSQRQDEAAAIRQPRLGRQMNSVAQTYDRPRPWRRPQVFFKMHQKLSQRRFHALNKLHGCAASKAAVHLELHGRNKSWACSIYIVTGSPALCWCGHHRHSRTTFYNSYMLVSEHASVAPYSSFRVYQSVPLKTKPRWLTSHTPAM